ncbi:MAG: hypothetical protein AMXMBFR81_07660 [Chthonomonas sp.]
MKRQLVTLIALSLAAMTLVGCSETKTDEAKPEANATGSVESTPASTNKVVDGVFCNAEGKPICPVMNSVVESEADAVEVIEHEGVKYYICCAGCPDKFKADPAKYAIKL